MVFRARARLVLVVVALFALAVPASTCEAVTAKQRAKLKELTEAARNAGQLYSGGQHGQCAKKVTEIQRDFIELLAAKDPALLRLAKPVYARLERAHGLLELEGAELEPLPSWSELTDKKEMKSDEETAVSFKDDIAPWFVSACGNCHINNRRGKFSLATFADLMQGASGNAVLFAGSARGSRIAELIESGDMPRGGGNVSPEQLNNLKKWIDQGAQFDGPNPAARLDSFANRDNSDGGSEISLSRPTDADTVSFATDIAPILIENCTGCHIAGRRASGNLRMDTFSQLLRGGDSGTIIANKNPGESLLIKKLNGQSGQRMPAGGRAALSDEVITLISTWIGEGAAFDGPSPETGIDIVANQAWAAGASHQELFTRRRERALQRWSRVLPNDAPETANNENVLVLGNVPVARLRTVLTQTSEAIEQAKKLLRTPANEPLINGGITVFVLKSRYDYSEFGKMTEGRELPKNWLGHWQADPLDVYAVLAGESDIEEKQASAVALQVVAGAYIGSLSDVPTWFAEGVARNLVALHYRRNDPRVALWQQSLPLAVQKVDNPKTILENRLDEESAGLVGMALTHFMMDRSNRRRFDKLLELLQEGRSFKESTTYAFAPPETIIKTWLGIQSPQ